MPKVDSFAGILTFTGVPFVPWDPDPDLVNLTDIAHALSHQNRWNGHTQIPVSVAEHSLNVLRFVERNESDIEVKRKALLHDATEAYIPDLCSPVKHRMPQFMELEDKVWHAICERFNMTPEMPEAVEEADLHVFYYEYHTRMPQYDDLSFEIPKPKFFDSSRAPATKSPRQWKHEFLSACQKLGLE